MQGNDARYFQNMHADRFHIKTAWSGFKKHLHSGPKKFDGAGKD
jgi:hypothetical protein